MVCCFLQAEDGIRDYKVTGVQTCALPIFGRFPVFTRAHPARRMTLDTVTMPGARTRISRVRRPMQRAFVSSAIPAAGARRSEERRVGKECGWGGRWGGGQGAGAETTESAL